MNSNTLKDVSILTAIPETALDKIFDRVEDSIIHNICELENDDEIIADISIGNLKLKLDNSSIKFQFEPSERFKNKCIKAYTNKDDALMESIEQKLIYRITNTYKDLI